VRIKPVLASAAALATVTAYGVATASTASASSSVNYVALGDSYSSGVGAGSYSSSSGSCDRSANAYAQLWANAHSPASFNFVACSGAKTSDVLASQVSALNSSTTLVSITIGGNDAGFSSVMETCVLDSDSSCTSAVSGAESFVQNQLPAKLNTTLSTIHADAPNAKIVVLDYPEFYDLNSGDVCVGLDSTDRSAIDQGANDLDSVIETAAHNNGDTFVDVRGAFTGHELCDDGNEWLHALNILNIDESYHPTAAGQQDGYLPVFTNAAG
jgi:lysophospholipase L1-like esterase